MSFNSQSFEQYMLGLAKSNPTEFARIRAEQEAKLLVFSKIDAEKDREVRERIIADAKAFVCGKSVIFDFIYHDDLADIYVTIKPSGDVILSKVTPNKPRYVAAVKPDPTVAKAAPKVATPVAPKVTVTMK
jgi:hypothetical protein